MLIRFFLLLLFSVQLSAATPAVLDEAEQNWLQQQDHRLRVGIALVPPQQAFYNQQGELEGLGIEYLDALEETLGVQLERIVAASYGEMMRMAKAREIDVVYAASRTAEREAYLDFTRPYNYVGNNIFVRQSDEHMSRLSMFEGESLAVTAGTAVAEYVRSSHPDIRLVEARSSLEAFNLLAAGQVKGVGATAASAYKHVYEAGLHNIALAGPLGYDYAVSMAARNDWPVLTEVLQKGLDAIPAERVEAIQGRWNKPADNARIDLAKVREYMVLLFTIGIVVLALVLFWWNRSLKREITHRKEVESRLSYQAYHDEITGLLNRTGFLQQLQAVHERGRQYGLVLLGLDQFRVKNELWGQQIGNELLKEFAHQLQRARPPEVQIARVGGDEFALLCPSADILSEAWLEHMLTELRRPMMMSDRTLQVLSASAGVVAIHNVLGRPELTLQQAEVALKYAKREHRGSYMRYNANMGKDDIQDQLWKDQLVQAIEGNQLFLEYQPQLDLHQERVIGFEALVRWQHPERGRVAPCDFIPLAERTGLISSLGDWVLRTACEQACLWRAEGIEFDYVAVNVSVRQFVDADFVRKVRQVLSETGLPARCLELEITETLFMNDYEAVRKSLDLLHDEGIRFSIDDFGTGFSSLLYLKELPVETLKLAQEFVLDIVEDSSSRTIVNAATRLGHSLGMRIIAEGVEGEQVEKILHKLDCDMVQGYFYSRPVPPEKVTAGWLAELAEQSHQTALASEELALH